VLGVLREKFRLLMGLTIVLLFIWEANAAPEIRIGLSLDGKRQEFSGNLILFVGKKLNFKGFYSSFTVSAVGENLKVTIGKKSFFTPRITVVAKSGFVGISGKKYRGKIECWAKGGRLVLVNVVDLEDYLKGVVPKEMGPNFPEEALKAQAVIARTYALKHLKRHSREGYDLCDTQHCQVYGGVNVENPKTTRAVTETYGIVLMYKGELVNAFYTASCGGRTASSKEAWGRRIPYLVSHADPFCKSIGDFSWKASVSLRTLTYLLREVGVSCGNIKKVYVYKKTGSGRVSRVAIVGNCGRKILKVSTFKYALNRDKLRLKSTLFRIKVNGSKVYFYGKGFGHGVGLCQWGAYGMAKQGYTWRQILKFYYPGVLLRKIY